MGVFSTASLRRLPFRREPLRGAFGDLEGMRWSRSGTEDGISLSPTSVPRVLGTLIFGARSDRPLVRDDLACKMVGNAETQNESGVLPSVHHLRFQTAELPLELDGP